MGLQYDMSVETDSSMSIQILLSNTSWGGAQQRQFNVWWLSDQLLSVQMPVNLNNDQHFCKLLLLHSFIFKIAVLHNTIFFKADECIYACTIFTWNAQYLSGSMKYLMWKWCITVVCKRGYKKSLLNHGWYFREAQGVSFLVTAAFIFFVPKE